MLTYRIDKLRRIVEVTGAGILTLSEFLAGQARLLADPEFDASFALLADYRAASFAAVDGASLRTIAQKVPFAPEAPRAFVVASDASFGVMRMFETYSGLAQERSPVRAFRDVGSAMAWIEEVRGAAR